MAKADICDGCHQISDGPLLAKGFGRECEYCSGCADLAQAFLDQVDDLHRQVAEDFTQGLEALSQEFSVNLKKLPYGP